MGKGGSAHAVLDLIGKLYGVEHQAKKQKLDPEQTKALRAEKIQTDPGQAQGAARCPRRPRACSAGYRLCPREALLPQHIDPQSLIIPA
jgi:hypothetical protein